MHFKSAVTYFKQKLSKLSLESGGEGEKMVFNIDRNGKKYAVQLKKVKWDSGDNLEKAQMLQVCNI